MAFTADRPTRSAWTTPRTRRRRETDDEADAIVAEAQADQAAVITDFQERMAELIAQLQTGSITADEYGERVAQLASGVKDEINTIVDESQTQLQGSAAARADDAQAGEEADVEGEAGGEEGVSACMTAAVMAAAVGVAAGSAAAVYGAATKTHPSAPSRAKPSPLEPTVDEWTGEPTSALHRDLRAVSLVGEAPLVSGMLCKKGTSVPYTWKDRYCQFYASSRTLVYWESEADVPRTWEDLQGNEKMKGSVKVCGCSLEGAEGEPNGLLFHINPREQPPKPVLQKIRQQGMKAAAKIMENNANSLLRQGLSMAPSEVRQVVRSAGLGRVRVQGHLAGEVKTLLGTLMHTKPARRPHDAVAHVCVQRAQGPRKIKSAGWLP